MDAYSIRAKKSECVAKFGPWTDHNMHLGQGVYTISQQVTYSQIKLRRILQLVADLAPAPLRELRILDLACLEGMFGIEFARRGASVVGIEGRRVSVEKCRFAKDLLCLDTISFAQDDIRNLSRATYGEFDVVLCLGVLYHLNAPDVFHVIEQIAEVCKKMAVFDTFVSLRPRTSRSYGGRRYFGLDHHEHSPEATAEDKRNALWASLDNVESFWLTRPSLYRILTQVGYTSLFECHSPAEAEKPYDRLTLAAIRGERAPLLSAPLLQPARAEDISEQTNKTVHECQRWYAPLMRKVLNRIPLPVKRALKRVLAVGGRIFFS